MCSADGGGYGNLEGCPEVAHRVGAGGFHRDAAVALNGYHVIGREVLRQPRSPCCRAGWSTGSRVIRLGNRQLSPHPRGCLRPAPPRCRSPGFRPRGTLKVAVSLPLLSVSTQSSRGVVLNRVARWSLRLWTAHPP